MGTEFNYPSSAVDIGVTKPVEVVTNASANTNTVGPDNACKRVLVKAFNNNTDLVWVDFTQAAVANACYPLDAGQSISCPVANTNLINILFAVANEKAAIVYSN